MTETSSDTLRDLQELCSQLDRLEVEIAEMDSELKRKREAMNRLRMDTIPELFHEVGLQDITLQSGVKIEVTRGVDASISADNRPQAFQWLHEHGYDDIIKTEVDVQFDRSQSAEAQELYDSLRTKFPGAFLSEKIHPSTLKSFVRERLEAGDDLPMDVFGARSYQIAKIKRN